MCPHSADHRHRTRLSASRTCATGLRRLLVAGPKRTLLRQMALEAPTPSWSDRIGRAGLAGTVMRARCVHIKVGTLVLADLVSRVAAALQEQDDRPPAAHKSARSLASAYTLQDREPTTFTFSRCVS